MKTDHNRDHADEHPAPSHSSCADEDCVIVVTSKGTIVRKANDDLVFIPGEAYKDHPLDARNPVVVARFDNTIFDDLHSDVPQEYIYRKRLALQSELFTRYPEVLKFADSKQPKRVFVLVDDFI